ncbi:flavin reductase family protein [Streptomyces sp. CNQ085]|uniref:flavin reductase family protein n=1 Tax=Streptomyces sp. CNQ085 TaxID=2886944 RepID=UPI001F504904|nr:flavin reductase family protein [Streptomyces sp. CNQ085]MCI0384246.1 flavin reductase family protein [Streptomyces sp. CNQ085]
MSAPNGIRRTAEAAGAGPDLLRAVFRRHAAGVAVITAHGHGRPAGFTATSLASVAAEPPLISFNIATSSSVWPVVAEAEHVGVHILGEHQRELADTFARPGADRFAPPTRWRRGPHGAPVLEGVLAWTVCAVVARVPTGDHRVVLAEVVAGDSSGTGRPLLYHAGRYNALGEGTVPS